MRNYFTEGKTVCDKAVLAAAADKVRGAHPRAGSTGLVREVMMDKER